MPTTVSSDGVTLWWDALGEETPPLLLIQGLGYPAGMWWRILPGLASTRRTIRFDNRGVGQSSVPETPWTLEDMADDAIAVLDAADVDKAHVFGVSMGGAIAQEVALRNPERVDRLILGCTHPGGREAMRAAPDAVAMLMDRTPRSPRDVVEASVPFIYAGTTPRADIDRDLDIRVNARLRGRAYWGQMEAMRKHEGTYSRLGDIAARTLVLHGTADRLVQPANAELLAAAIPHATLHWLDGASHVFWTDQPEETIRVVNDFLAAD